VGRRVTISALRDLLPQYCCVRTTYEIFQPCNSLQMIKTYRKALCDLVVINANNNNGKDSREDKHLSVSSLGILRHTRDLLRLANNTSCADKGKTITTMGYDFVLFYMMEAQTSANLLCLVNLRCFLRPIDKRQGCSNTKDARALATELLQLSTEVLHVYMYSAVPSETCTARQVQAGSVAI